MSGSYIEIWLLCYIRQRKNIIGILKRDCLENYVELWDGTKWEIIPMGTYSVHLLALLWYIKQAYITLSHGLEISGYSVHL